MPGETVRANVFAEHGSYVRASAIEVLSNRHPERTAAPCPYFARCGGCSWQHARYEAETRIKVEIVIEQMRRLGGFDDPPVRPMIPDTDPYHYRNQARLSTRRDGTIGFAREGTHAVMTIEHCHLVVPPINDAIAAIQGNVPKKTHQVLIRHSLRTGESLIHPALPDVPFQTGQRYIHDRILDREFRVAANSFFQVNTRPTRRTLPEAIRTPWLAERVGDWSQADLLALLALDRLEASAGDLVLDAYCGVGTFALLVADRVGRVVAVEEATSAIEDATHNAGEQSNVTFLRGRVETVLPDLDIRPRAAILDPARAGCERPVLDALIARPVERLVYVSCDPATLARDLRILVDGGYHLREIQPIDMFPRTYHVECVATLDR